ncbi:NADAR family protein [Streptomyces qinzhouensis]|uniref:NADAR family protein n=1 Tax=Streptomyces qinzhouensis TaxID=2599401 RepID=A0A5B8J755_9ACTN|nr:NADAR family protein [Streptomyces qinzhouensis]QDY77197.1 NADAR family protein [Streptomyces qinzhouensis]
MIRKKRLVHREADGRRIPGTWRHAFINNGGRYYLTDLFIYADGIVDAWEPLTLAEFERKLACGWVATELPEGGQASAHALAVWKFGAPATWHTPEQLLAEVRDTVEELNGRPDSTDRCLAAVDRFMADRTEANRLAVREAYFAIPENVRHYALGDMDLKDWPLRVLAAGVGGLDEVAEEEVGREEYEEAIGYFTERQEWGSAAGPDADGGLSSVHIPHSFPAASDTPDKSALRNTYPAPVAYEGTVYPTVTHAYWALSTPDPAARAAITAADTAGTARLLGEEAARHGDWERTRTAVLGRLLRAKFDQHPELAAVLLATGTAAILYDDMDDPFWGDNAGRGRNWMGRLLELTRAELPAPAGQAPEPRAPLGR